MKRLVAILVPLAMICGLTACGTTKKSSTVTSTASTANAPIQRSMSKAQAVAFAHAVNLRPADLPGFRVSSEKDKTNAQEKRLEHDLLRCVGAPDGTGKAILEAKSKEFEHEAADLDQNVSSEVEVMRSSKVAARDLAIIQGSRTPSCLSHYLGVLFASMKTKGVTFKQPVISSIPAPLPGTSSSFGYRIATAIETHGQSIPFTIDIFGFVDGPAEVTLFTSGLPQPFPSASEQRLFSLLLQRSKTRSTS